MKIVVTGSLGNISKPLTKELVENGHDVTVISSNVEKKNDIEALGANAAIGSLEDADFLTSTFEGADAVYTMVPPSNYFNPELDLISYYQRLGDNYAKAIKSASVTRVVHLSTIGGHLDQGSGILIGAHNVEGTLNKLAPAVSITHMRPTSFFYNLFGYLDMIKNQGFISANYGSDKVIPWVSPIDIAAAIAEEIVKPVSDKRVRYVASEELTGNETARILGDAIGKPDLKWKLISDEETLASLQAIGMNKTIATGLVELYACLHNGQLAEDYYRNRPAVMGKVKLKDFSKEFAAVFNQE
ncbi:MAG: NAD(P)H-binding protein [Chryseolinea sp.]